MLLDASNIDHFSLLFSAPRAKLYGYLQLQGGLFAEGLLSSKYDYENIIKI
jgi:hypothetical protein